MAIHRGEDYLKPATMHSDRQIVVKAALKDLRKKKHRKNFDAIVVSGYSSTIIGSIIADKLGVDILIARKPDEPRNSKKVIDGVHGARYVFIDDLIASGATLRRVRDAVESTDGTLYGVWLYRQGAEEYIANAIYHHCNGAVMLHSHIDYLRPY